MVSAAGSRLNALYTTVDVTSHEQTKNGQRLAKILLVFSGPNFLFISKTKFGYKR